MEEFPFAEAEWGQVMSASLDVTSATLVDDQVLRASCFVALQQVLSELRARYGEHPVLLETEADYCDDETERVQLYESAIRSAETHGLPALSIRLSFARLLLDMGRYHEAKNELSQCEQELASADEAERKEWLKMFIELDHP